MVNKTSIFKKIGYILNELQDQYQFLSENPDQLSELELELFLANANFLSDHVQIIKKLNDNPRVKELPEATATEEEGTRKFSFQEQIVPPQVPQEKAVEEPVIKEPSYADSAPTFEFIINDEQPEVTIDLEEVIEDNHHEEQVDYQEPVIEPEHPAAVIEPEKPAAPLFKEDDVKAQEIPKPTTSLNIDKVEDKIVEPVSSLLKPTINDLLASQKSAGSEAQATPAPTIMDLKRSVNLNEKLLYIKELFNGYNLAYSEAIDIVNKLPDFKAADAFLQNNYAVKNNWQAKQSTVDKFYALLKQRFPQG